MHLPACRLRCPFSHPLLPPPPQVHRRLLYEFRLGSGATVERSTIRERRTEAGDVDIDNLNAGTDNEAECQAQLVTHLLIFTDCMCFVDARNAKVPVVKGCVLYPPGDMISTQPTSTATGGRTRFTFRTGIAAPDLIPQWTWEVHRVFLSVGMVMGVCVRVHVDVLDSGE